MTSKRPLPPLNSSILKLTVMVCYGHYNLFMSGSEEAAIQLVGDRHYNRYIWFFAGARRLFNDRDLMISRLVLQRENEGGKVILG
jgi:hypothetical protein